MKHNVSGNFEGHYIKWREARINKLVEIFGINWFKGKEILELACGYGHNGRKLREMGAIVTQTEGDEEYAKVSGALVLDQDKPWDLGKVFDMVIHWGVLYHLDDWRRDLRTAIKHGKIIALESEVLNSDDPAAEEKLGEGWYDGALNATATKMSAAAVEKVITEEGATFERYDDSNLNVEYHRYNWQVGDFDGKWASALRRFWIIKNE